MADTKTKKKQTNITSFVKNKYHKGRKWSQTVANLDSHDKSDLLNN